MGEQTENSLERFSVSQFGRERNKWLKRQKSNWELELQVLMHVTDPNLGKL